MKKAIITGVLAVLMLRLAVLAGAGDALAAWVRELGMDEALVSGLRPAEASAEPVSAPEPTPEPTPVLRLVTVTPAPSEKAPDGEEYFVPEAEVLPANLSSASRVHNSAGIELDLDALAAEGLDLTLPAGEAQVLIFHTHSSEAYTPADGDDYEASDPYRTEDKAYSVIRVGDLLAEKLEEHGLTVIHDREIYDYPSYTGSYNRSGAAVEAALAAHPGVKLVIDLHRDALGDADTVYKTQAAVNGETSAQVMLLVGTGANGLPHPYWQENLKLALYMQNALDAAYPTLARPIELVKERYNQQLSTGSLILEVGSSGNTLQEALTAIGLFGDAVGPALAKLVE